MRGARPQLLDRTVEHLRWQRRRIGRAAPPAASRFARATAPASALTFHLGRHGRLGNQLFQIAGTIGIAERFGSTALFRSNWEYRRYFSLPDSLFATRITVARCVEAWPLAVAIPEQARPWLQDLSLWSETRAPVREWLRPSQLSETAARETHRELLELPSKTSIHVRRGDYLDSPSWRTCPVSYYEESVAAIRSSDPSTQLVVFSDDIEWCRKGLPFPDAIFVGDNPDWLDLVLMAHCEHHVCANSTFSWWGAYLSNDPSPIVPWVVGCLPPAFRMAHPAGWREVEIAAT
jgi:hypothetical protein